MNCIYNEDCLEGMARIPDGSIDMILCDLPYGVTACHWDSIIPFDLLWEQYNRVIRGDGAIALFSTQPFTTTLINSNPTMFKYCWYWRKSVASGWQHAKNMPLRAIEEICIFSKGGIGHQSLMGTNRMRYFTPNVKSAGKKVIPLGKHGNTLGARPNQIGVEFESFTGYQNNLLEFPSVARSSAIHPTQKPVELFETLIKAYTEDGDLVLDTCMGSGTTAIACLNTKRNYIGFELDKEYYDKATERIASHKVQQELL